ncbi:hypothetical protein [Pseudomonas sp. B10(2017)]|uniref:hypothetical protein n=1 Tax=Pseudomonas sp. B10(2017) TaxID=1981749 RepID=UPI000A1EFE49|nr:hypothetical protein [Pseudomonas sp. B10(2017)]
MEYTIIFIHADNTGELMEFSLEDSRAVFSAMREGDSLNLSPTKHGRVVEKTCFYKNPQGVAEAIMAVKEVETDKALMKYASYKSGLN